MLVKRIKAKLVLIAIIICVVIPISPSIEQASPIKLSTDKLLYPYWKIGGGVNVTATQLAPNSTYYLWVQRPTESVTNRTNVVEFQGANRTRSAVLMIRPIDPAGTYLASLSTSSQEDTRQAMIHFGIMGTDKSSYQRTESILIKGGGFSPNSTVSIALTSSNGTIAGFPTNVASSVKGDLTYAYKAPLSAVVGGLTVAMSGKSFDQGQNVSASFVVQMMKAALVFTASLPRQIERTATLSVNVTIAYPDGGVITKQNLPSGINLTMSASNFVRNFTLNYISTSRSWVAAYLIPRNASLGEYSLSTGLVDAYGNRGEYEGSIAVVPAKLRFLVPLSIKADPQKLVDVSIYVQYPSGSILTDKLGQVTATTNSSGTGATYPLVFNATEGKWHLLYRSPELGFNFGKVVSFTFNASDTYGNSGSMPDAYHITVGADTNTIILAVIAATIVPAALLVWAIVTVSKRRRKYKP